MRFSRIAFLLVALVAIGATNLSASLIYTQTFTFPVTATDVVNSQTVASFSNFGALPFAAGYTLSNVSLKLAITETITGLTITNTSAEVQTYEYSSTGRYTLGGTAPAADVTALGLLLPHSLGTAVVMYDTGVTTIAPSTTIHPIPPNVVTPSTGNLLSVASLTPYRGVGSFTLSFASLTGQSMDGGGGNLGATQTTTIGGVYTVTYTYDVSGVPEPATLGLMGSALIGLGLLGFKRLKRS